MAETAEPSPSFDRYGLSNFDTTTLEGTPDDLTVVDAASLRRQVCRTRLGQSCNGKLGEEVFSVTTKVSTIGKARASLCAPAGLPSHILYCSGSLENLTPFLFITNRDCRI